LGGGRGEDEAEKRGMGEEGAPVKCAMPPVAAVRKSGCWDARKRAGEAGGRQRTEDGGQRTGPPMAAFGGLREKNEGLGTKD